MTRSDGKSAFTYELLQYLSAQSHLLDLQPGRGRSRLECRQDRQLWRRQTLL